MKSIIFVALVVVAIAVAAPPEEQYKIVRSEFVQQPEGGYSFAYETDNGIVREETGEVKEVLDEDKKPHKVVVVRGSYTYKDIEGVAETVHYYSDETGYHAEGPSIPQPPARR